MQGYRLYRLPVSDFGCWEISLLMVANFRIFLYEKNRAMCIREEDCKAPEKYARYFFFVFLIGKVIFVESWFIDDVFLKIWNVRALRDFFM